jgi:hypothetical protein
MELMTERRSMGAAERGVGKAERDGCFSRRTLDAGGTS